MELIDRYLLAVADRLFMDNKDIMTLYAGDENVSFKMRRLHDIINLTYGDVTRGKQEVVVDTNNHTVFFKKYGEENYEGLLIEIYKKIKPTPLYNDNIITFATYIEEYDIYLGVGDVLVRLQHSGDAYSYVYYEVYKDMSPGKPSLLHMSWDEADERRDLYYEYRNIKGLEIVKKTRQKIEEEVEEVVKGEKRKLYKVYHEVNVNSYSTVSWQSLEDECLVKTFKVYKEEQKQWYTGWTPAPHEREMRDWLFPRDYYHKDSNDREIVGYIKVYPYYETGFIAIAYDSDMNKITSKFNCNLDKMLEVFLTIK